MLPSLSEALAESATTLPVVNVCPFAGLVRLTVGATFARLLTVMLTLLELVAAPALSTARA